MPETKNFPKVLFFAFCAVLLAQETFDFGGAGRTRPWRTAQADPGKCDPGYVYYNPTTSRLRLCGNKGKWQDVSGINTFDIVLTYKADVGGWPIVNFGNVSNVVVYVNGLRYTRGVDYIIVNGVIVATSDNIPINAVVIIDCLSL